MFKQKISSRNSIKFKKRKIIFMHPLQRAIKTKIYRLRWVWISIILFIIISVVVSFLSSINHYLKIVIIYSITGFLTFFMAYFGWILAKFLIDKITDNNKKNENIILHYFKKLKKIITFRN